MESEVNYFKTEDFINNCEIICNKLAVLYQPENNITSQQYNEVTHEVYAILKTINDAPKYMVSEDDSNNPLYNIYRDLMEIYGDLRGWYYSLEECRRQLETVTEEQDKKYITDEINGTISDIKHFYSEAYNKASKVLEVVKLNVSSPKM